MYRCWSRRIWSIDKGSKIILKIEWKFNIEAQIFISKIVKLLYVVLILIAFSQIYTKI